jgi:hypothetical protein
VLVGMVTEDETGAEVLLEVVVGADEVEGAADVELGVDE